VIVFDLQCDHCGVFEAWFRSGADFDDQSARGLVECPACGSKRVAKAPMAPRIPAKVSGDGTALARLAELQSALLKDSEWVGERFAEEARAMHLGVCAQRSVHGQASAAEAKSLIDEGIPISPLPLPVVPPSQVN